MSPARQQLPTIVTRHRAASLAVGLASALILLFASGAHAATVTIGQLFTPTGACTNDTFLQTAASGASYVVSAPGVITSWSFQTDASTTPGLKFKVGSSVGGSNYMITGEASAGAQVPSASNTYSTNIPVRAGDVIGVYGTSGNCGSLSGGAGIAVQAASGDVPLGSTAPFEAIAMGQVSVSAQEVLTPGVASVSPAAGSTGGGSQVTVTGHDLAGATAVSFGGLPAQSFTVNSDTSITAVAPAAPAGAADLRITGPGGQSPTTATDRFTYFPTPVVTSVTPALGPRTGGTMVTIRGAGFTSATAVSFGGNPAVGFGVASDALITAVAPAAPAGSIDVTVTNPGGPSSSTTLDRFTFVPVCVVPNLHRKNLRVAMKALKHADCSLGKVTGPKTGRVRHQSRKPGTLLRAGTKVNIKLG
jgi:IPT/TIG domain